MSARPTKSKFLSLSLLLSQQRHDQTQYLILKKQAPPRRGCLQAADKVQTEFMVERAIDGSSVALFHWTLEFKDKNKTVGFARQQLHFLCSDKENEAKENLALR